MKKRNKLVAAALALAMTVSSLPVMGVFAEEGGKFEISVTGGGEDSMVLDTSECGALNGLSACRHLFEGLYKLDANGEVVLGQAASVETSEDGLDWTFTLRDDITWSDGQPVTAPDFIFGFNALKEAAQSYEALLSDLTNPDNPYEAPDDKTVVIHLASPTAFLPSVLAFPPTYPIREDLYGDGETYATDPDKAVYNGPYELTDWQHQSVMTMELRDDYYDSANIQVEKINWYLVTEERSALASFENGEYVYSDLIPDEEVERMDGNGLHYVPGNNNYCIMFNLNQDPEKGGTGAEALQDVNVRKALALAVDRQRIMDIRAMNDEPGITYASSGYTNEEGVDFTEYADPWLDIDNYEGNCEEAKQLLADAGYPDGQGFPVLKYIVNNASRKEVAEMVASDWKSVLGIDATVETSENFFTDRDEGNYDVSYFGWFMDYEDLSNMYSSMLNSDAFWESEEFTTAYNAAISTSDQAEQWEHYKECEAVLAKDLPVSVLLHSMNKYLFHDDMYDGLVYNCSMFVFTYLTQK